MGTKLKSCPFCGADQDANRGVTLCEIDCGPSVLCFAKCEACSARAAGFLTGYADDGEITITRARKAAAEAWNRRANKITSKK